MTWNEALQAMRRGETVTHNYFSDNEWMRLEGAYLVFEDGVKCSISEFFRWRTSGFEDGYSIREVKNG